MMAQRSRHWPSGLPSGLVELQPDAHDKRTKHAALTTLGRNRLDDGIMLWAAANRRVEAVLGSTSARMLRALADQVSSKEFLDAYKRKERRLSASNPSDSGFSAD
jgi:hypothetical protein